MKKMIAVMMALALAVIAAIPVLAEEAAGTTDSVTSATTSPGKDGHGDMNRKQDGGQQPPAAPDNGQAAQEGQPVPAEPDNSQAAQNGQPSPAAPGIRPNGKNGRQNQAVPGSRQDGQQSPSAPEGRQTRKAGKTRSAAQSAQLFDRLLQDGVITQELYDAIMDYLKNQPQQSPSAVTVPAEGSEPPAEPDGAAPESGGEPPALPDGAPEMAGGPEEQLLKDLLDSGVITRDQYDLLLTRISAPAPAESGV